MDGPNQLWITDITEHPSEEGKVFCAAVMDAYSRLVIGWSIADHMRTELVTDALGMALLRRRPESGTILHSRPRVAAQVHVLSIRSTPTTSRAARLDGNCRRLPDNAMMESFWGTMQLELLDKKHGGRGANLPTPSSNG